VPVEAIASRWRAIGIRSVKNNSRVGGLGHAAGYRAQQAKAVKLAAQGNLTSQSTRIGKRGFIGVG